MKTIEEQIEVMQHYANGGEVEWNSDDRLAVWMDLRSGHFNWIDNDYRIKEHKYPMWFKHRDKGYIIKFYSLQKGELAAGFTSWLDKGMIIEDFTPHTDKDIWEQVEEVKEQKKTITIDKWLCKDGDNSYYIVETSHIDGYEKVKLLETYEVEI